MVREMINLLTDINTNKMTTVGLFYAGREFMTEIATDSPDAKCYYIDLTLPRI